MAKTIPSPKPHHVNVVEPNSSDENDTIEINDYIENRTERNERRNIVKTTVQVAVTWMNISRHKITDSAANAQRAGDMDRKCTFKASSIARHERLWVLKEIKSQEIQAGAL
ncbi:hypothetical protein TNIN_273561 [Trichonephila inaurata madagascariensis]|uniref:Uncharacterized protein n=1 Tax=Trichonephila inaurata madagascariensis TaxID=2747483 RepID=A0A8X6KNM2_9ARAC|nr:hypothetical protein TNIN_113051 [Trichonephila inaurata madagascariensis]GFY70956.1 hypothetical protein TNIN_273561 [Trichonephila inaurata madagascariensis]